MSKVLPFFVTLPHSGEDVPVEAAWLHSLESQTLMRDVDRYVDKLYEPVIRSEALPYVITQWHRYVVDLNRRADEFDASSVQGASHPVGRFPKGLHWSMTTQNEVLITQPMSMELHQLFLDRYYQPFHEKVQEIRAQLKSSAGIVYHLDLHSMPSKGTAMHPDPGQTRADVVISDFHGTSSVSSFRDIVLEAYQNAGFVVAYNWPYVGGGITQMYGQPKSGFHTIQVELNRSLYMDEVSQKMNSRFTETQQKLSTAISQIKRTLGDLSS